MNPNAPHLLHPAQVLVIGASGLVGRHVLTAFGERARGTCYSEWTSTCVRLDVRDDQAVERTIAELRPTVVVLAAAEAFVERCEANPIETREINVNAAASVRRAADRCGAIVVAFSSEYVFDGRRGIYFENDEVHPINEYGRQKMEMERIVRSGPHLICRTSGVFGEEPKRKNFVLQLVDVVKRGGRFPVPSDQVITPTYAPSLGTALVEMLDRRAAGTFHVCGPRALGRFDFARMVASAYGLPHKAINPTPTAQLGLRAARPAGAGLSDQKLRAFLGHSLLDPEDALRLMAGEDAK